MSFSYSKVEEKLTLGSFEQAVTKNDVVQADVGKRLDVRGHFRAIVE